MVGLRYAIGFWPFFHNDNPAEEPEREEEDESIGSNSTLVDSFTEEALSAHRPLRGQSLVAKLEDPWARKNVLCLDGGGIRGYASLLIIRALMEKIARLESQPGNGLRPHASSFMYDRCRSLLGDTKYRPHHYFDYFVGTSTGGLSAIMLGRLQMTVDEALALYDTIGNKVFAHPRDRYVPGCLKKVAKMIRTRFDEEELENALREAIDDHLKAEISRTNVSSKSEVPLRNENPDAAQTIVVAWGGSQLQDSCLFRSYDHPPPAPNLPDEERYGHLKPYSASPAPIWAVARATSAAPTYFKRIRIGDGEFWDGAVGEGCNNPVRLAYNEMKQMHRHDRPAVILSVGTGPRADKSQDMSRNSFKEMIQLARQKQRKSSNAEETHYRFRHDTLNGVNEALEGESKIVYERLNPEGISSVKLDTWLPLRSKKRKRGGADTKRLMEKAVERYLAEQGVEEALDRTAGLLVQRRRKRAAAEDCGRWERFAMHLYYGCPDSACSTESLFKTRDDLREHAFYRHGIVWQIDTKHGAKWDDRAYSCRWDNCGQKYVPVFATEIDFRDHLMRFHKLESPQIMDYDEYEQWLDDGRDQGANRSRSNSRNSQIRSNNR